MRVELRAAPFDALAEASRYRAQRRGREKTGASSLFIGTLRDLNDGEAVRGMSLEHYPGMTEKYLKEICNRARRQWSLLDVLALHRTGAIATGDDIVLIATWAVHRGDAMDATRFIIEELKHRAPFWKKEMTRTGARWVEQNTSGYSA